MSFSKSLSRYIAGEDYKVARLTVQTGRTLLPGETSRSGLYGIVSNKGVILRVSLYKEIAEMLSDYDTRNVQEIFVTEISGL